jgi:hypothetical protein
MSSSKKTVGNMAQQLEGACYLHGLKAIEKLCREEIGT